MAANYSSQILFSVKCWTSSPLRSAEFSFSHELWTSEPISLLRLLFFSCFFLFVFFVNAAVPCKYMTSFFGREKPHNVCSLLHLFISVCWVPERLWLILPLGSLMRSPCVLQDRNSSVWKFFSSVARRRFWGRHLEASASFQLLPVSLRCLLLFPHCLYLSCCSVFRPLFSLALYKLWDKGAKGVRVTCLMRSTLACLFKLGTLGTGAKKHLWTLIYTCVYIYIYTHTYCILSIYILLIYSALYVLL